MPSPVNLHAAEFEFDPTDPPGYTSGVARVGALAGGTELAVKLFEIPPGESLCPYHVRRADGNVEYFDGES